MLKQSSQTFPTRQPVPERITNQNTIIKHIVQERSISVEVRKVGDGKHTRRVDADAKIQIENIEEIASQIAELESEIDRVDLPTKPARQKIEDFSGLKEPRRKSEDRLETGYSTSPPQLSSNRGVPPLSALPPAPPMRSIQRPESLPTSFNPLKLTNFDQVLPPPRPGYGKKANGEPIRHATTPEPRYGKKVIFKSHHHGLQKGACSINNSDSPKVQPILQETTTFNFELVNEDCFCVIMSFLNFYELGRTKVTCKLFVNICRVSCLRFKVLSTEKYGRLRISKLAEDVGAHCKRLRVFENPIRCISFKDLSCIVLNCKLLEVIKLAPISCSEHIGFRQSATLHCSDDVLSFIGENLRKLDVVEVGGCLLPGDIHNFSMYANRLTKLELFICNNHEIHDDILEALREILIVRRKTEYLSLGCTGASELIFRSEGVWKQLKLLSLYDPSLLSVNKPKLLRAGNVVLKEQREKFNRRNVDVSRYSGEQMHRNFIDFKLRTCV